MSIPIHTYDAVIVGSGLAGSAAARELKLAGKNVAVITKLPRCGRTPVRRKAASTPH